MRYRTFLSVKRLVFSVCFVAAWFSFSSAQDEIVAIVNDEIITMRELNDFIHFVRVQNNVAPNETLSDMTNEELRRQLLEKLIEDKLILQEAKKSDISVDEGRIHKRIQEIIQQYGSEENFRAALNERGLTPSDIESRIREQVLMNQIINRNVRSAVTANPKEVTEFYEKNESRFVFPCIREFEYVKAADAKQALEFIDTVKGGLSMKEAAAQFGLEISQLRSAQGDLSKEIEDEVAFLKEGEVSKPVEKDAGFYIFSLRNVTPERKALLYEVQADICSLLNDRKMQEKFGQWMQELKKKAYIKIML